MIIPNILEYAEIFFVIIYVNLRTMNIDISEHPLAMYSNELFVTQASLN